MPSNAVASACKHQLNLANVLLLDPGAVMEEGANDVSECTVSQPTVLVLGSEGFGLRTNTRRACTGTVSISAGINPSAIGTEQAANLVDSLNVSVATGILLHDLIRRRASGHAEEILSSVMQVTL